MPGEIELQFIQLDGVRYLTVNHFARYRGVTVSTVSQKVKAGRLPYKTHDGKKIIPVDEATKSWNQQNALAIRGKERQADFDPVKSPAWEKTTYEAELKKLELKERSGELVETDQIKKQVLKFFHAASAVIDNFADRVHVQLAEMTDPDDVYKFLLEEMDVLKENIRNAISNSGPGKGDSGSNQHSVPEEAPVDRIAVGG